MLGGITEDNVRRVAEATGATEIHFAARDVTPSGMEFRNPDCGMGAGQPLSEFERWETTEDAVRRFLRQLG